MNCTPVLRVARKRSIVNYNSSLLRYIIRKWEIMSKLLFNTQQIIELQQNIFVLKVTEQSIDFTFEFREHIVLQCSNFKESLNYFKSNNLGSDIIGSKRIEQNYYCLNKIIIAGKSSSESVVMLNLLWMNEVTEEKSIEKTEVFNKLSSEQKVEVLLKQQEQQIELLKKYMPSLDGLKVKKN